MAVNRTVIRNSRAQVKLMDRHRYLLVHEMLHM